MFQVRFFPLYSQRWWELLSLYTYGRICECQNLLHHHDTLLTLHSQYRFWRVTFWMFYGGLVFLSGWIMRAVFARDPSSLSLYIAQTVLVLCGPPIFAATEYNILARIMRYLPMHAPIGPNRVIFFFTYLSALVESLTAAGGGMMARTDAGIERVKKGSTLVAIAIVLQAVVQIVFASVVAIMHRRTVRANMLTSNVRTVFIMLYGTSVLVIIRCVYRAVEKFS